MGTANGFALILAGVVVLTTALVLHPETNPDEKPPPTQWEAANTVAGPIAPDAWREFVLTAREAKIAPASATVVTVPAYAQSTPAPQFATSVPRDHASLARELQGELKRVGCYSGEINGIWTMPTRQAMKAFIHRVNASLPLHEPDIILLTLVRAHQGTACGSCPAEQGLSDAGRCVPNAILAKANKKGAQSVVAAAPAAPPADKLTPAITSWSTTTTPATSPLTEGRMALAAPVGEAQPAPSTGPPPASVTRKPVASPRRYGTAIFKQLDRMGNY